MSEIKLLEVTMEPFVLESLYSRLHLQEEEDRREFQELAVAVHKLGRPRVLVMECEGRRLSDEELQIADVIFRGKVFSAVCGGLEQVFLYCATCGPETRVLEAGLDMFQRYWLEELRMRQLQAALQLLENWLRNEKGMERPVRMGPGSGAVELWPLNELDKVFHLLGKGRFLPSAGVELTESMLMLPAKSTAGLYYSAAADFHSCQLCRRENCPNRQVPFHAGLWERTMTD